MLFKALGCGFTIFKWGDEKSPRQEQNKSVQEIKEIIISGLKDKLNGEVGLNFISGVGKEHMALLGALIKLGIGFRMIVSNNEAVEEV